MKSLLHILCPLLLFTSATAQKVQRPTFEGNKPFETFMAIHFRVTPEVRDSMTAGNGTAAVVFSFVINGQGRADSLVFHESTPTALESEIRRLLAKPENRWKAATRKGQPVVSAPFFQSIYIVYEETDKAAEKIASLTSRYRHFAYQSLPNWQRGSIVIEPMQVTVFQGIVCDFKVKPPIDDLPSGYTTSRIPPLQKPVVFLQLRPQTSGAEKH
ncbi:hypothetical protein [Chitinophaga lutea]|nr:hypothetical protein [Chitinophaga lutea]